MLYCKRCVQPDTRPGIYFSEEGICGACLWEDERKSIDWEEREKELQDLCLWAKKRHAVYDCVIGVSGGKDSTFQALYARDRLKLRPLLVCGEPAVPTEIGRNNLENLIQLGFDIIRLRPNPQLMKKLIRSDFYKILNICRPIEYALYASSYIIADKLDIPLIIQGENAGQTLGTREETGTSGDGFLQFKLNTVKLNPLDLYVDEDTSYDQLFMFRPDFASLAKKDTRSIFLSYYVREWSQPNNALFAIKHGLNTLSKYMDPYEEGLYREYYSLDDKFARVNQFFKYIKLGFGCVTDHACYDIRSGFINREEGAYLVRELDGHCPLKLIQEFCNYLEIDLSCFWRHIDTFRGPMWLKNSEGQWQLDNPIWKESVFSQNLTVNKIRQRLYTNQYL